MCALIYIYIVHFILYIQYMRYTCMHFKVYIHVFENQFKTDE